MEPIVVGIDDSAGARAALRWALDYARTVNAPLIAVTAVEVPQIVGRAATLPELTEVDSIRAATADWMRELIDAEQAPDRPVDVTIRVVDGHPVDALVTESKDASLVVVGARGAGLFHRLLLGSVSTGVLHHAFCSVVIVRSEDSP